MLSQDPVNVSLQNNKDLTSYFKSKGLRWTIQRQMVLDILRQKPGHTSAEEIHQILAKNYPAIDLSTIYRTLEILCEMGMTVEMSSKPKRYEITQAVPHHHLQCIVCNQEFILDNEIIDPLKTEIFKRYKFTLKLEHFVGSGYCKNCLKNNEADKEILVENANLDN